MNNVTLSENQFSISIGMSEAEILGIDYANDSLTIIAKNVELLCDFRELDFYSPNISYDEWLNMKYFSDNLHEENFQHIKLLDVVKFVIHNPRIFYEGTQIHFIDILGSFDIKNYDTYPYSYLFGGTIEDSNHDEFEVCSNQNIEFYYNYEQLKYQIQRNILGFKDTEEKHFDIERELKRQKLARKNNSTHSKLYELLDFQF